MEELYSLEGYERRDSQEFVYQEIGALRAKIMELTTALIEAQAKNITYERFLNIPPPPSLHTPRLNKLFGEL